MSMAKSGSGNTNSNDAEGVDSKKLELVEITDYDTEASLEVVPQSTRVSTPISILVESLVKDLCSVYENDQDKVSVKYRMICDQLFRMKMIDESYRMIEFEGMRMKYQRAFHKILKDSLDENEKAIALRPASWPDNDGFYSHYCQEFEEIGYISEGGFGKVFRVKHILDSTEYAIKKVPIRAEGITAVRNYLSEVKTFASLNHPNIVQYKAAWLELGPTSSEPVDIDSDTESYIEETRPHLDEEYVYHHDSQHSFSKRRDDDTTSDFQIDFEHSIATAAGCASNRTSRTRKKRTKHASFSEGGKAACKVDVREIAKLQVQHKARVKWATLYIQMALCHSTLKQWLERRNESEFMYKSDDNVIVPVKTHAQNETIQEVLRQLLKGLEYIHSKGIVHHDIKPSNIFIQIENESFLIQLGDFGLACPLQNVRHALGIGTRLYAAPEQLLGICDPKSDMYSLGIVLFELVESFHTDMEKVRAIDEARQGNLPVRVQQNPQLAHMILQLLSKDPRDRPTASTLLKSVTDTSDAYIHQLESQLAEKDEEIMRLKGLLKSAGVKGI